MFSARALPPGFGVGDRVATSEKFRRVCPRSKARAGIVVGGRDVDGGGRARSLRIKFDDVGAPMNLPPTQVDNISWFSPR